MNGTRVSASGSRCQLTVDSVLTYPCSAYILRGMTCLGKFLFFFLPYPPFFCLLVKFPKNTFWAFWILGWLNSDTGTVTLLSGLSTFLCISILINLRILEEGTASIHHLPFSGIDLSESSIALRFVLYFVWLKMSLRQRNALFKKRWVGWRKGNSIRLILGGRESPQFQTYSWASHYVEGSLAAH